MHFGLKKKTFILCVTVLPVCMSMPHMCAWCLLRPKECIRYPVTKVMNGCEPSSQYWEPNLGSMQEQ